MKLPKYEQGIKPYTWWILKPYLLNWPHPCLCRPSCDHWKVEAAANETISHYTPWRGTRYYLKHGSAGKGGVRGAHQPEKLSFASVWQWGKNKYLTHSFIYRTIFVFDHHALLFFFSVLPILIWILVAAWSQNTLRSNLRVFMGNFLLGEGDEGSPPKPLVFARPTWILPCVDYTHTTLHLRWRLEQCWCGLVNNSLHHFHSKLPLGNKSKFLL